MLVSKTKSILYILFSYSLFSAEASSAVHANNRTERGMLTLFVFFIDISHMGDNSIILSMGIKHCFVAYEALLAKAFFLHWF